MNEKQVVTRIGEYFKNMSNGEVVAEFGYGECGTYIWLSDGEHRRTFYFEDGDFREYDEETDLYGEYDEDSVVACCVYAWERFKGLIDEKEVDRRCFYED